MWYIGFRDLTDWRLSTHAISVKRGWREGQSWQFDTSWVNWLEYGIQNYWMVWWMDRWLMFLIFVKISWLQSGYEEDFKQFSNRNRSPTLPSSDFIPEASEVDRACSYSLNLWLSWCLTSPHQCQGRMLWFHFTPISDNLWSCLQPSGAKITGTTQQS